MQRDKVSHVLSYFLKCHYSRVLFTQQELGEHTDFLICMVQFYESWPLSMQIFKKLELCSGAGGLRNVQCLNDSVLQRNSVRFIKKRRSICFTVLKYLSSLLSGKPVMIVIEYMENGALDAFLRVSIKMKTYINIFKMTYIIYILTL